ncbi:MAG TPA: radical SAM protein [Bryobacteraceae bacterium]|nr:radical SAM protein [Bryobacteraceae bacterium]
MTKADVFPAWGRILSGHRPLLALEITRECPLRCPGCYAYELGHLPNQVPLRELSDLRGDDLVNGVLALVRRFRPIHISIVGGEPLVRYRELDVLLPKLAAMRIEVQLVTSAVRPIPAAWAELPNLHLVVSIDGLQPEHDRRRSPATYARILENISSHRIIVHCTVTRKLLVRPGYLRDFVGFWSERQEVRKIWFSLFTPQEGDYSEERLTSKDRSDVVAELSRLRAFPKVDMPEVVLDGYLHPPESPRQCAFAQLTTCISADLATRITPCQFGGRPVCSECGCMASAGLAAIAKYKLGGLIPVSSILSLSRRTGEQLSQMGFV